MPEKFSKATTTTTTTKPKPKPKRATRANIPGKTASPISKPLAAGTAKISSPSRRQSVVNASAEACRSPPRSRSISPPTTERFRLSQSTPLWAENNGNGNGNGSDPWPTGGDTEGAARRKRYVTFLSEAIADTIYDEDVQVLDSSNVKNALAQSTANQTCTTSGQAARRIKH